MKFENDELKKIKPLILYKQKSMIKCFKKRNSCHMSTKFVEFPVMIKNYYDAIKYLFINLFRKI